jgi:hypothetical protein
VSPEESSEGINPRNAIKARGFVNRRKSVISAISNIAVRVLIFFTAAA